MRATGFSLPDLQPALGLQARRPTQGIFYTARPKRLRFLLLNTVAKVVRHAREALLRCTKEIAPPGPSPAPREPASPSNASP